MKVLRRGGVVAAAGLMAGAGIVATAPVAAAADITVVAVAGTDGHAWIRRSTDPSWTNLGGQISGAPSVVTASNGVVYLAALSPNNLLYMRTLNTGWRRLSNHGVCGNPSIAVSESTLHVACRSTADDSLHFGSAPLSAPFVTNWRSAGGVLESDPAVVVDSSGFVSWWVEGGANRAGGNVWVRTVSTWWEPIGLSCKSRPAVYAEEEAGFFACANPDDTLTYEHYFGEGFVDGEVPGVIEGNVGLAISADRRSAVVYAQSPNGAIYHTTISSAGHRNFTRMGGSATGGAGATNLRPLPGATAQLAGPTAVYKAPTLR